MNWSRSLPTRVAVTTAAMLGGLLLILTIATYSMTALLLRQGIDMALMTALPMQSRDLATLLARANEFERRDPGARYVQVVTSDGQVVVGSGALPVDPLALASVRGRRVGFSSVALVGGALVARGGPSWWQALTPVPGEVRVIYVDAGPPGTHLVLQMGMPTGMICDVLPRILRGMLLLSLIGVLLAGLVTWRMTGETYRPLRAIMNVAGKVNTKTLATRVPEGWRDETLERLTGVLNAMIARLEEAFETQGRFVASAAHELRSPLAAMRAELEVALRRKRSPEEYEEALAGALEETGRLTALAEHLLILARYERGASLVMEDGLALAPLLERVAAEIGGASGKDVRVSAPPELILTGDPIALERMVSNLVRNAIEAGGAPVEVEAGSDAAKGGAAGGVWISVRDHGPGVPPEAVPFLFEPFYRADPARGCGGGAGLGLAIVKAIVEAHKGSVDVENVPDGGVRFTVRLAGGQPSGRQSSGAGRRSGGGSP